MIENLFNTLCFYVFFQGPAEITSAFEDMKVGVNSEFVVLCEASGKPTPIVKLYHKGTEMVVRAF